MDSDTLIAISLIITAAGTVISPVLIYLNGRSSRIRGEKQAVEIGVVQKELVVVKENTNGLVSKLIDAKDKETAAKTAEGVAKGHEEGLKNGRSEARIETLEQRIDDVAGKK